MSKFIKVKVKMGNASFQVLHINLDAIQYYDSSNNAIQVMSIDNDQSEHFYIHEDSIVKVKKFFNSVSEDLI